VNKTGIICHHSISVISIQVIICQHNDGAPYYEEPQSSYLETLTDGINKKFMATSNLL